MITYWVIRELEEASSKSLLGRMATDAHQLDPVSHMSSLFVKHAVVITAVMDFSLFTGEVILIPDLLELNSEEYLGSLIFLRDEISSVQE